MQFSLATLRIDGVPTPVLTVDDRHYRIPTSHRKYSRRIRRAA